MARITWLVLQELLVLRELLVLLQERLHQQQERLQQELLVLREQQQACCRKQTESGPTEQRSERNVSLSISFSQWLRKKCKTKSVRLSSAITKDAVF
ncbi:MAG TPA: hypothetical protein VFR06_06630 [Gallionellaceae bacterium]|nr:hypothetical protein [Gallionellaceae bacterium]